MDREKVIMALELHRAGKCQDTNRQLCPYWECYDDCYKQMADDILSLLKEQKKDGSFIVIDSQTGKEADTYNIALHEDWAKHLCYCDMDGWAIQDDGSLLLLDECGRYAYADRERFKVVWDV